MWTKIAGILLRNRIAFIIGIILCTIIMGLQIPNVRMSYTSADLLPKKDSAYIDYENFKTIFGKGSSVMVFGIKDTNFFELNKVNDWIEMGDSILAQDGVTALVSLTHAYNLVKNKELRKFDIMKLFPHHVDNQQQLDSLKNVALNLPFYNNLLVNKDSNAYSMMITVSKDVMNSPKRIALVNNILKITEQYTNKYNVHMHYSGMPYIRVINAENTKREMYLFIALSLLVTAIILYLFFKSFRIVGFCVLIIGFSVVWAVGFMGLFRIQITLLTAMLPPLLIVIGIPNCVYMVNKYHAEYVMHGNKIKALQRTIQKIGNATLLSNLTTAAGFTTFVITSSRILVEFGFIAFLSIASEFLICLILIPTVFSFLPVPDKKQTKHLNNKFVNSLINEILFLVKYRRSRIYYVTAIILIAGFVGITYMKTTGYMVDDLKESDPIRKDLAFFELNFSGLMPMEVTIDFGKPKRVMELSNLQKLDKLNKELSRDPELSRSISIIEAAKFANQAYYNGNPKYYKLPNSMTKNFILKYIANTSIPEKNVISAYDKGNISKKESNLTDEITKPNNASSSALTDISKSFMSKDGQMARMSFRVNDIGTKKMEVKEAKVYNILHKIFPNDDVKVTGSSIIFFKGNKYLIKNLFTSLVLAIILIAGFMAWMFKSKKMVLFSLIPNIVPQILTAALMGYFDIPIKASTILVFSVAFGISVDNTIHYLAKYGQELSSTKMDIKLSVIRALKEAGQSMIYTSIILFFGFSIFCLSSFGGTFALGLLTSITLFAAMLANLILLPSLLLTMNSKIARKIAQEPMFQIYDEEDDIDLNELTIRSSSEKKNIE